MSLALVFEGLTKEYRSFPRRKFKALADFSLEVQTGEIFGFLGPNGAGKTTAIHLAMGFMHPSHGKGQLLGKPFGNSRARRKVGFLAENVALYHRRAESLVRFYGALNGMSNPRLAARAREVLNVVGLDEQASQNVSKFSRGMLQRIGLAQALVNDPELLILDEPTSAMDPSSRVAVRELLLELRNAGKTIFLSSHLLSEIELICDRVAVLHHGKLMRVGNTKDLLQTGEKLEVVARGTSQNGFHGGTSLGDVQKSFILAGELRKTLEQVWSNGGEVLSVNPTRRSLEDMFLELTGDAASAKMEKAQ